MRRLLSLAGVALLILVVISGCMVGMTLEQRIQQFADDLNTAARTNIQGNFHPSFTSDYAIIDPGYFDSSFPVRLVGENLYTITIQDSSNEAAVLASINGDALPVAGPVDASFSMAPDGLDYKIVNLQIDWSGTGTMEWVVQ
jgi:hypothetical protein